MAETFDITPSPRVLRMLGYIDFKAWQCLAELIDNSVDGFLDGARGLKPTTPRPYVKISLPSAPQLQSGDGQLVVLDNGPGMTADDLERAVRAGYSGNDPTSKLGLFGMGFNIATARLGLRTEVWTTTPGESEWTGILIDLEELERKGTYRAPRLSRQKAPGDEQVVGTEVVVQRLREPIVSSLVVGRGRHSVRSKLGTLYGRLIERLGVQIEYGGDVIGARRHCVWDATRNVEVKDLGPVAAFIPIDHHLGTTRYCTVCWQWLRAEDERCPVCGLDSDITERERRITGWLGIQRFLDKDHYGIDLIRNGRVIEPLDKSLFYWEVPGTDERLMEYPIDAPWLGGRIVGELEIDFVAVSHHKDAFDRYDPQWNEVVRAIRGEGPLQPELATRYNHPRNDSPLGRVYAGYRKVSAKGLRWLIPAVHNDAARAWAERFWAGDEEYQDDTKWYDSVLQGERQRVAGGATVTEEVVRAAAGELPEAEELAPPVPVAVEPTADSVLEDDLSLSGEYVVEGLEGVPVLTVLAKRCVQGHLVSAEPIELEPSGTRIHFRYDPAHEFFASDPDGPLEALLMDLGHQFLLRSGIPQPRLPLARIVALLRLAYFPDTCKDPETLARRATELLGDLRAHLALALGKVAPIPGDFLSESEMTQLRERVLREEGAGEDRVAALISYGEFIKYVDHSAAIKAVRRWPELVLDGEFLSVSYSGAHEGARSEAADRVVACLNEIAWLSGQLAGMGTRSDQWKRLFDHAAASLRLLLAWRT